MDPLGLPHHLAAFHATYSYAVSMCQGLVAPRVSSKAPKGHQEPIVASPLLPQTESRDPNGAQGEIANLITL